MLPLYEQKYYHRCARVKFLEGGHKFFFQRGVIKNLSRGGSGGVNLVIVVFILEEKKRAERAENFLAQVKYSSKTHQLAFGSRRNFLTITKTFNLISNPKILAVGGPYLVPRGQNFRPG